MSEKKSQVRNHKETLNEILFDKEFYDENDKGDRFPKNRVQVAKYDYKGEYLDRDGNYKTYEGTKVKITNSKLTLEKGNVEIKKKIVKGYNGVDRIYNDETTCVLSEEHLQDIVNSINI